MKVKMFLAAALAGFALAAHAQRTITLDRGWTLQQSGSDAVYEATVPSTVMGVLTANGLYAGLLEDTNYKDADRTPFDVSWWWRTTFDLPAADVAKGARGKHVSLDFDGISYRANIWLNGKLIASSDRAFGTFCRLSFDITDIVREHNTLAVEVFRAQPGEPNIGFVDWNPRPLDENTGIFRPVTVNITGAVEMRNTWVRTLLNTETLAEASLIVETDVANLSNKTVKGVLAGRMKGVGFSMPVTLAPGEKRHIAITPADVAELRVVNPRVWWCSGLGEPELYGLDMKFSVGGAVSDEEQVTFGIRRIETYFTEEGYRGYILNGRKVLIKGAGWTDDIFLRDTPESNERQVKYVKDMNLNTIRFENIWGTSQNIYNLCDRYGILALVGWSCQWEWESYLGTPDDEFGCIRTEADMELLTRYLRDQVLWLRNHPSIIAWYGGSDKLLHPELERRYMAMLPAIDDRPYIGAAANVLSAVTGETGMKMNGPYEYVGPNYWFVDGRFGGAYGFNTETGPGAQLPVRESIEKFIAADELWPIGEAWNYHCTVSTTAMNSLDVLTRVMNEKYGTVRDLDDYLRKADLLSYESTKSMFEAFRVNKPRTTGLIQWMLNSAWPSMYWQLYDYYGIPNSAYYGVKRANNPWQLVYNYSDGGIYLVNEMLIGADALRADVKVFSTDSELLLEKELRVSSEANSSKKIFEVDAGAAKNSFVALALYDAAGKRIAENFYALSATQDTYGWDDTSWVTTPITEYADFKALAGLPEAALRVNTFVEDNVLHAEITNISEKIAFFTSLKLKDAEGGIIFPAYWSDNYIDILPGDTRTLECRTEGVMPGAGRAVLTVSGWNVEEQRCEIE